MTASPGRLTPSPFQSEIVIAPLCYTAAHNWDLVERSAALFYSDSGSPDVPVGMRGCIAMLESESNLSLTGISWRSRARPHICSLKHERSGMRERFSRWPKSTTTVQQSHRKIAA